MKLRKRVRLLAYIVLFLSTLILAGVFLIGVENLFFLIGPGGYRFQTSAVYEAPQSGYRIEVKGKGIVRAGDDLSEEYSGLAIIRAIDVSKQRTVRLSLSPNDTLDYEIVGDRKGVAPWTWKDYDATLIELLSQAGYEGLTSDEVGESSRVINGVLSGPKGTILEGQSKFLRVVRVDLHY